MFRIILALVISSLLMVGPVAAAPDSVVFEGGDVRINGSGNALVFPDGTTQSTATLIGPQGPQGIQGIQGEPGVANGISKGVHGTIVGSGTFPSIGSGYTVVRSSMGSYVITFSSAFSSSPDCVMSPKGHSTGSNDSYIACEETTVTVNGAAVVCRSYVPYVAPAFIDTTFSFICVQ